MTNEQLKVLLMGIVSQLNESIDIKDKEMLDSLKRPVIYRYTGLFTINRPEPKDRPDLYETCLGSPLVFDGVDQVIKTLNDQIEAL